MLQLLGETKEDKLRHYARTPGLQMFAQFIGWYLPEGGDQWESPDEEGHFLTGNLTNELMSCGADVRVLVSEHAERQQIANLLLKIADWLQSENELLDDLFAYSHVSKRQQLTKQFLSQPKSDGLPFKPC